MTRACGLLGALCVILFVPATFAQAVSTASVTGTTRDGSGAVLPGVTVTALQTETGLLRTVVSDQNGGYVLANLPVGPYRFEFAMQGFRTAVHRDGLYPRREQPQQSL